MAFLEGGINSETVTIVFEIDKSAVASPEPSHYQGVFIGPQTVAFEESDETSIKYTPDGSEPSLGTGTRYERPITLTGTTTVKSRSFRQGCQESEVRGRYISYLRPESHQ